MVREVGLNFQAVDEQADAELAEKDPAERMGGVFALKGVDQDVQACEEAVVAEVGEPGLATSPRHEIDGAKLGRAQTKPAEPRARNVDQIDPERPRSPLP